ncbi:MAG TPA: PQQ-binding-like beta-propeller repeat protein [Nitrososphaerales archaeon]
MSIANLSRETSSDWQSGSYDLHHTGFSPQNRINRDNLKDLELKWVYQIPENPFPEGELRTSQGIQASPLVVKGITYVATNYNRVIALDALNGEEIWSYQVDLKAFFTKPWWAGWARQHSIIYYRDAIYMLASDGTLYSFDPSTGAVKFTIPDTFRDIPGNKGRYFSESAPAFYNDTVVVGAGGGGWWNGRGYVAAYDLKTRELLLRWFASPPAEGDPNWDREAGKGNIEPYPGDWGEGGIPMGGGVVWGRHTVDEETGILYILTSNSCVGPYDASLRPGPHLYASSVVALDVRSGEMIWYYQVTPHDLNGHQPAWSPILATAKIEGIVKKIVIVASKGGYIYVFDSKTGGLIYEPVKIGPSQVNAPNTNAGSAAKLFFSQKDILDKVYCPGEQGGIAAGRAFAYNTIYVPYQRCGTRYTRGGKIMMDGGEIEGYDLDFFVGKEDLPEGWDNTSSLYAIDASDGRVKWNFDMPARYQSASLSVSGGVVYAVDRSGNFWAVDAHTGQLLRRIKLGGLGQAGIAIGADSSGNMMLFAPVGNIVMALGFPT